MLPKKAALFLCQYIKGTTCCFKSPKTTHTAVSAKKLNWGNEQLLIFGQKKALIFEK